MVVKLTRPHKTHVKVTPEMLERAAKWLEEPFEPVDVTELREEVYRDLALIRHGVRQNDESKRTISA